MVMQKVSAKGGLMEHVPNHNGEICIICSKNNRSRQEVGPRDTGQTQVNLSQILSKNLTIVLAQLMFFRE